MFTSWDLAALLGVALQFVVPLPWFQAAWGWLVVMTGMASVISLSPAFSPAGYWSADARWGDSYSNAKLQQWNLACIKSTCPDTNCTVSFQINPHWISNSALWKVVLETKSETAWKTDEGSLVAWLWLWTGWLPSIFSWFGTTWLFSVPNMKQKHLAGKQYRTDDEVIHAVEDFFEDQDESFYTTALQHRWKQCVDRTRDYVEKCKCQFRPLNHSHPTKCSGHPRIYIAYWTLLPL